VYLVQCGVKLTSTFPPLPPIYRIEVKRKTLHHNTHTTCNEIRPTVTFSELCMLVHIYNKWTLCAIESLHYTKVLKRYADISYLHSIIAYMTIVIHASALQYNSLKTQNVQIRISPLQTQQMLYCIVSWITHII
jgi:hypothetical protein